MNFPGINTKLYTVIGRVKEGGSTHTPSSNSNTNINSGSASTPNSILRYDRSLFSVIGHVKLATLYRLEATLMCQDKRRDHTVAAEPNIT